MGLSRRAVIVGLIMILLGAGVIYGTTRLISRETVLYLASDDPGPDPFTDPAVFTSDVPASTTTAPVVAPTDLAPSPTASPSPGATAATTTTSTAPTTTTTSATTPFEPLPEPLFPGAQRGDCDVQQLLEFLNADADLSQAWVDVLGIDSGQLEDYVASLTPVVLSRDARVTMYGYRDGEAQEFQAILAEGNSALVDSVGDLVVRCYSGSPVSVPRQIQYRCEGCPEDYSPPPPCDQTCYPEPTTTTTTVPSTTTTSTTLVGESTTTTRRSSATTTRAGAGATTRPGGTAATTRPGTGTATTRTSAGGMTTTTTQPPTPTGPTTTAPQICLGELCIPLN
jgi:hypothetical protein